MAEDDDEPEWELQGIREAMCEAIGLDVIASYDDLAFDRARLEIEGLWFRETFGSDPQVDVARLRDTLNTMRPFRKSLRFVDGGWRGTAIDGDAHGEIVKHMRAVIDHLEPMLVATLAARGEAAKFRPHGAPGKGRPPKKRTAYLAAELAATFFLDFTGTLPTYSTEGTTPYKRMLDGLFRAIGIKADMRRPAEWAIGQIPQKNLTSAT
jgi:hypothetical protein